MKKRRFTLSASISTDSPEKIRAELKKIFPDTIREAGTGTFEIKGELTGESAKDLNRDLLSRLRRIEKRTRLRAEWTCAGITERFFDYVPKGSKTG